MTKSKMSVKILAEAESCGHVYDDGRILLAATGKLFTLSELRKMKGASNRAVRYADANDGGSDEPWG